MADLRAGIGAAALLWGQPSTMGEMESRSLHEHEELVAAIADGHADRAAAVARAHVATDVELISTAMRRAGVLADWARCS